MNRKLYLAGKEINQKQINFINRMLNMKLKLKEIDFDIKQDKLLESNPKVEEIFYGRKAMDLSLDDCKDIIRFIELQEKLFY